MVVTCLHERAADRSRRTDSGSPAVRYRRRVRRSRTASRESFADCRDVRSRAVEPFGSRIGGRRRIVTGRAAGRRIARNRGPRRLIGVGMHRRKCSAGDSEKGIARRVPVVRGVGRTEFQPAYAVRARPDRRGRRVLHSGRPDRIAPVRGRTARRIEVYGLFVGGRIAAKQYRPGRDGPGRAACRRSRFPVLRRSGAAQRVPAEYRFRSGRRNALCAGRQLCRIDLARRRVASAEAGVRRPAGSRAVRFVPERESASDRDRRIARYARQIVAESPEIPGLLSSALALLPAADGGARYDSRVPCAADSWAIVPGSVAPLRGFVAQQRNSVYPDSGRRFAL